MATPYANAVAITNLSFSGLTVFQQGLIDGEKWGGGYGRGVTLSYSFPWAEGFAPYYSHADYGAYGNEWLRLPGESASYALNAVERAAVRRVLNGVERAANITFTETIDDLSTVGELRFAETRDSGYAHAYLPHGDNVRSGDVWFAYGYWNPSGEAVRPGTYEYMTIIHEVGHALGLKHSFESGASGVRLPAQQDHYQWTVMAYNARQGNAEVWAEFHPTTLMYLDLVALQKMYGKPTDANLGNTRYVYRDNRTYWETVSDSGGRDTVVYDSDSRGGLIDLSNRGFSRMGKPVFFSDGARTLDTIRFGPSTIIENAAGGSGDDRLIGNRARNTLTGNDGNDALDGAGGPDTLRGGAGADTLEGGAGNDTLIGGAGGDRLVGGAGDDLLYLEQAGDRLFDGGGGRDTVRSWLTSCALGTGLENLELAGRARNGTGNELGNMIEGNGFANVLRGGAGNDSIIGSGGADSLDGGSGRDTLGGGTGNDTLNGGTGRDRLAGGEGDDVLVWDQEDSRVDGGGGIDTLLAFGDLDLSTVADNVIFSVERLDLAAGAANLLTLGAQDILDLFGGTLTVLGDATDTVDITDAFTAGAEAGGFRTYAVGAATLLIDTDITTVV
jgi:serralysin